MLTTPQRSAHLVVQSQFLNTMVGPQLLHAMVGTQLNLFENLPNSQPISSGHDVIHTPPTDDTLELLTRIVQSPTKLNDEI